MSEPLTLSLGQKFELERMSRVIDATVDTQALQGLAKQLLQAWQSQKAATQWVMRQQLDAAPRIATALAKDESFLEGLRPDSGEDSKGDMDVL